MLSEEVAASAWCSEQLTWGAKHVLHCCAGCYVPEGK